MTTPTKIESEQRAVKINDLLERMILALIKVDRGFTGRDGEDDPDCDLNEVSTELLLEIAGSAALLVDRAKALEILCLQIVEV